MVSAPVIYYIACTDPNNPRVKIGFTTGNPYVRLRAQAKQSMILGEPIERWVRIGLQSMHESNPLPEELAALL